MINAWLDRFRTDICDSYGGLNWNFISGTSAIRRTKGCSDCARWHADFCTLPCSPTE